MIASLLGGLGASAAGSLVNYVGNKIGQSSIGGQAKETREAVSSGLDMAANKAENFLVNSNAAGQKGRAATIGFQKADGSFAPDASLIQRKAESDRLAADMQDTLGQRVEADNRMRQMQNSRMEGQVNDMAALTGGNAAAIGDTYRQMGEQQAMSNLQGNEQAGQQATQLAGTGEQIRGQAEQAYQGGLGAQYDRDVKPYMNQWTNMEGLAAQSINSTSQGVSDTLINNPFESVGKMANYIGGGLTKDLTEKFLMPDRIQQQSGTSGTPTIDYANSAAGQKVFGANAALPGSFRMGW